MKPNGGTSGGTGSNGVKARMEERISQLAHSDCKRLKMLFSASVLGSLIVTN